MSLHKRSDIQRASSFLLADALFFGLTDPMKVTSPLLILGFLLVVATFYLGFRGLIVVLGWYGWNLSALKRRWARTITLVFAGGLALQSVGQFSTRDLIVLMPLTLLGLLYLSYGRARTENA